MSNQYQSNGQKLPESLINDVLNRRQTEFPAISHRVESQNGKPANAQMVLPNDLRVTLSSILSGIPAVMNNYSILPALINKILSIKPLTEKLLNNKALFEQEINNPSLLQMLFTQIYNDTQERTKPMDMSIGNDPNSNPENNDKLPFPQQAIHPSLQSQNTFGSMLDSQSLSSSSGITQYFQENVLPNIDDIFLMDYNLILDVQNDLHDQKGNRYTLKFTKFSNISKIEISSLTLSDDERLDTEPFINIKFDEIKGRCLLSNHENIFGRLIKKSTGFNSVNYVPENNSCRQVFSNPISLDQLTVSFQTSNGKYYDPSEILILRKFKIKTTGALKFITKHPHNLKESQEIKIHFIKNNEIEQYTVEVFKVEDQNTFYIEKCSDDEDNVKGTIKIYRTKFTIGLSIKFYEINWNQITGKSVQNAQLTKLNQLLTDAKKPDAIDQPIISYIKSKMQVAL